MSITADQLVVAVSSRALFDLENLKVVQNRHDTQVKMTF